MLTIGSLQLDVPFMQAALSGYSDLPMRRMARRFGAPYTLNEVVLDKLVVQKGKTRRRILHVEADDHPVGGQLMGANPDAFGPAAADLVAAGFDVIDINFACPVKKVLGRCRGGFLLSQPATALEIVRSVVRAVAGRCFPKNGAEGVFALALAPDPARRRCPGAVGIAVKIDDGSQRAYEPVIVAALRWLGAFGGAQVPASLAAFQELPIENTQKRRVGEVRSAVAWPDAERAS